MRNGDLGFKLFSWGVTLFIAACFAFIVFMPLIGTGVIGRTPKANDYYIDRQEWNNPYIAHPTNKVVEVKNRYVLFVEADGKIYYEKLSNFRLKYKHVGKYVEPIKLEDTK